MTEEGDNSGVDDYVLVPLSGYGEIYSSLRGERTDLYR
jgi:hypothetical protein